MTYNLFGYPVVVDEDLSCAHQEAIEYKPLDEWYVTTFTVGTGVPSVTLGRDYVGWRMWIRKMFGRSIRYDTKCDLRWISGHKFEVWCDGELFGTITQNIVPEF